MKKILSTTTSLMLCMIVFCQKGIFSIGVGPSVGFPVSNKNFSYYYKNGVGGSLQGHFGVSKLGTITTNVSFISIGARNLPVSKTSLTIIKAGYRTSFLNSRFFVATDAGFARYGSGSSNFVAGGTIGYSLTISKSSSIDLFPAYNHIFGTANNRMWLSANILFRVNLTKKNK